MTDPKSNEAAKTGKAEPLPEAKEAAAALPAPDSAEPLAAARKEAADNYERYVRAAADLENFRRRSIREKEDLRLYAASKVLEELLPVLDNLARGVSAAKQPDPDLKAVTGGVDMALQQFKSVLAGHGLIEINPLGQPFDPHRHEAISHQPSADIPAEHVANVVRAGYLLNGRLLRPAAVVVSSGAPAKR
jgi:molecular chaperone GrpE